MPHENILWKNKKSVRSYTKEMYGKASGVKDEKYVKKYIADKNKVKIVDLGIGSGRELKWLCKIKNIKEIVGIDYSRAFLDICKKESKKYKTKVSLINDDILLLGKSKKFVKKEKLPIIYMCLINTFGNFSEKQRIKILNNLRKIVNKKDRLILCLYKRPETIKTKMFLPGHIKVKNKNQSEIKIAELIEYASMNFLLNPIVEKYQQFPRIWYNNKTNDITIYIGRKKILISHRFSKEEIIGMVKKAKFKIEKLIEGKFMWVVISKI